jgi:3-deoxy-7-phosphoheptulonate synthase
MIEKQQPIITPEELRAKLPMKPLWECFLRNKGNAIKDIITGADEKRKLLIIGPCSAHDRAAVRDYNGRLKEVAFEVKDKLVIVPRCYTCKPRTNGTGYKGPMFSPDPLKGADINSGLEMARRIMLDAIDLGFGPADEMLNPALYEHMQDVLAYIAVGARSSEDQSHREVASGIDVPVGLKNPISGDLTTAINSVSAAQKGHIFPYNGVQVQTSGNPLAHLILRGYVKDGQNFGNYNYEDLVKTTEMYNKMELKNPAIIVDTNHANSGKKYAEQPRIAKDVLRSMDYNPDIKKIVKGFMCESFIESGAQNVDGGVYGKSITDPCLGWDESKKMIYDIAESVK